jgi:hypothetical protein
LAKAGKNPIFRASHATVDVAKPYLGTILFGFCLKMTKNIFCYGGFAGAGFSVNENV